MAIEMKITDQGNLTVGFIKRFPNMGNRGSRFSRIDGNAHQLRTRAGQFKDLPGRGSHICRIRVGHGLHHDGSRPTDSNIADSDRNSGVTLWD
jgi:hypothetical protein